MDLILSFGTEEPLGNVIICRNSHCHRREYEEG